jgi:hypothetical protein
MASAVSSFCFSGILKGGESDRERGQISRDYDDDDWVRYLLLLLLLLADDALQEQRRQQEEPHLQAGL